MYPGTQLINVLVLNTPHQTLSAFTKCAILLQLTVQWNPRVWTQDTSALIWWVRTVWTELNCFTLWTKPNGPKCLTPRTEVSCHIFWLSWLYHYFKRPYTQKAVCIITLAKTPFTY